MNKKRSKPLVSALAALSIQEAASFEASRVYKYTTPPETEAHKMLRLERKKKKKIKKGSRK